ncbi:DUF7507 domain-containing protein [Agromyces fucosus]|uniref:DUF7507 domain-containing protein n=1 Tax=Agromyces fucosus TaxID=41985 RepID=UPI001A9DBABF|nr:SdrD B-like domain-containing protein [Agromyces fucosus]
MVVFATVLTLVAGLALAPQAAFAGPGSLVGGVVWADTNRDGVRDAGEPVQSGVPVELLSSPGGVVVATTTTSAVGAYSFAGSADGSYIARVTAPGAFILPAAATGANDFVRAGQPAAGQPERGVSAPFAIAGATQVTALDAGLQPIASLVVERLPLANACDGFALTGAPPFNATDAPGKDTGTSNCVVRTENTVMQQYAASLTGLPSGASVPNVIIEFTIASSDGAKLKLVGPGLDGMPAGCLDAANGANPPSSRTLNPDGSITVRCNFGTMSSNVGALQVSYQFAGDTPIPSHASISARAYAAGGQAAASNTVQGPVVEVTGTAQWDLKKTVYTGNGTFSTGPSFTTRTIGGTQVSGYIMRYQFTITDLLAGAGGSDLVWPVSFVDVMPEFPNARIDACRPTFAPWDPVGGTSAWTLTCPPLTEVQGADGWNLSIKPNNAAAADSGVGHMVMDVFIPLDDMNRAIDPAWQPGDDTPTGTFDFANRAQDTDHWAINGGALNYGDGREPGWNGTGNNLAVRQSNAAPPQWDLLKYFGGNLVFSTETVAGVRTDGYFMDYMFRVTDLAGAENVAPWLDLPVTFKDRLVSHPGAMLLSCRDLQPDANVASVVCPTNQVQPADGWTISATPNRRGFEGRRMDFIARIFIPLAEMPSDPCTSNITIDLRNEAVGSENWTVGGQPNNPTGLNGAQPGFEPGWDGTTATGNNLDASKVRPAAGQCGSLAGNKQFIRNGHDFSGSATWGGDTILSFVSLSANNNRVKVDATKMMLCDVFDVSVFELSDTLLPQMGSYPSGVNVNPANYVIEYSVGPNNVNTQAGPRVSGYYPIERTSLTAAATDCRNAAGPWSTNPAADFGPDWKDHVNMVRARPIDPAHVEVGPFAAHLLFNLQTRTFYNGGPNAGEAIPSGVRLTNIGGWPAGVTGAIWGTVPKEMFFTGMQLGVQKTVPQATYLPGASVVWDLNTWIGRTTVGATLRNLRVVDTVPVGLNFDLACTQNLLPTGVTVNYDSQTRKATFTVGDVLITTAPQHNVGLLKICTTVDTLAQPGDPYVNTVQAMADNAENQPTDDAAITIVGSGQLGITKSVDKPFVASGETYTWTVDWGNTSTEIAFQAPDVIDVLPWNGDGDAASGSARTQYESDYTGLVQLTGPLEAPTYVRGGTGVGNDVAGTWYYSTADPSTVNHDARHASNADPAAPGGLWKTAAEIADFDDVTAVRFVSNEPLPQSSRVRSSIPMVSTSNGLDNVYVNKAMIFSATFPDQPLLSTEPYVLMPGFTLGDLVWADLNGNGKLDGTEHGVPGVTVQVKNANGDVVATVVTDAAGRWSVAAIAAGEYTVHIPPAMFAAGGPLADTVVRTVGSSGANNPNENADNNNTAAADPAATGLTSTPVTMSYDYVGDDLVGGNGPAGDDVAGLGGEVIPDSFTTFTVDLAVMPAPSVDIEKATNGQDADDPAGPTVTVGGQVRWTYVVTNTGGVDLTNVTVTDDLVDADDIDCDGTGSNVIPGPLAPDASFTCVATGTATAGPYENLGTVTGLDPTQVEVTDDDPSHYFGVQPSIDIEKATNGQDADDAPGPNVTVGGAVRWTYVVTNTGNATLTNVIVTDDLVMAADIDCDDTGGNVVAGPLAPDDSFTCVATGTATVGQYENTGTVTGAGPESTDVDGNPVAGALVTDEDLSHYFGIQPAIDIEKATNGQDADEAPGPNAAAGGDVRWTYVVTNTGDTSLTNVTVIDDVVAATEIDCDGTGGNVVAGPLAPDASFTCVANGTATAGQYENLGTVTGTGPETTDVDGDPVEGTVTDEDLSHYFGIQPSVDIEKATNGQDADEAPGPSVTVGGAVEWTYVVTNTGDAPVTNVTITDDVVAADDIDCDATGSNVIAGPLEPGDSIECTAHGAATAGQYANLGTVAATGPVTTDVDGAEVAGAVATDEDWSHYVGVVVAVPPQNPPKNPPAAGSGADLAGTGVTIGLPMAAGAILLGGGLVFMLLARRRKADRSID